MGRSFARPLIYEDTGDSNRIKLLKNQTNVKLQPIGSSYPTGAIALTETAAGTGIYKNDDVGDGVYILYHNDISKESSYGQFWIGDDDIPTYAKLTANNNFTGSNTFGNVHNYFNGNLWIYRPLLNPASSWATDGPPFGNSLVWKSWVQAQIAAINLTPYQESSNYVRVIPNGQAETGKVYTTPKAGSNYFGSPGINNQCMVEIRGTGTTSQYINMDANTLRNYVHFKGAGKHIKVIMRDGATNTKIVTFENLTIIFGANDFATAREYQSFKLINCDVYAYRDTTYNNCELENSDFMHNSNYKVYLKGTTTAKKCGFNNEPDESLLTTGYQASCYGLINPTIPTDPSTEEIES